MLRISRMRLLLVIVGFVVAASAIDMTAVLRENLFDVDGSFHARLSFTAGQECQRVSMTVDPLFVMKRAPSGKLVFASMRNGSIIAISRSNLKNEVIDIVLKLQNKAMVVMVNDVVNRFEADQHVNSITIFHPTNCVRGAVYSKEFNDAKAEEHLLLADHNSRTPNSRSEKNAIDGMKSAFRVGIGFDDSDPIFWNVSLFIVVLNGLAATVLSGFLLYEHFVEKAYRLRKGKERKRLLLRRDLEKKFPEETMLMRGLRPQLHVKGLTKLIGGHVTYKITERQKYTQSTQDMTPQTVDGTQKSKDKTHTKDSSSDVRVIEDSREEKEKPKPKRVRKSIDL